MARRLVAPPVEIPRLLSTLPIAPADPRAAKRAAVLLRALAWSAPGGAPRPRADRPSRPPTAAAVVALRHDVAQACGENNVDFVPAAELATGLMGDSIATNMFMLGYAYQKGWGPLSGSAIVRAIQLNGIAVEFNVASFTWGRRAAVDLERVRRAAIPAEVIPIGEHFSRNLDELVERRVKLLTDYQNAVYAARYKALVERVRKAESDKLGSGTKLTEAGAR